MNVDYLYDQIAVNDFSISNLWLPVNVASIWKHDLQFFYDRLLEASKDEAIVRSQDLFTLVRYVSLNKYGESMAWDWVTLNWDYLVKRWVCHNSMVRDLSLKLQIKLVTQPVNHMFDVSQHSYQTTDK